MKALIDDHYRLIFDANDPKKWCVELLKPCDPFHEILYSYGEFSIQSTGEDDPNPKFKYQMDILYVPERLKNVDLPDEKENEMENLIARILLDIIGKNADKAKNKDGKLYLELSRDEHE